MILRVTGFDFASGPIQVNIEHCSHCTSILYVHAATPPTGHGNHSLLARAERPPPDGDRGVQHSRCKLFILWLPIRG